MERSPKFGQILQKNLGKFETLDKLPDQVLEMLKIMLPESIIDHAVLDLNLMLDSLFRRCDGGGPTQYECLTCGKNMQDKTKMRRHVEVHTDNTHDCIVCHKGFKTRNALSTHYTRHHGQEVLSPWATD